MGMKATRDKRFHVYRLAFSVSRSAVTVQGLLMLDEI